MNTKEITNARYEVLTPTGFQHFDKIIESSHDSYIKISTIDDYLICSKDHILYMQGEPIMAKYVIKGMELDGSGFVWDVEEKEGPTIMYDLFNVKDGHKYFTNKFISSNCDCETFDSILTLKCEETNTIIRLPIGDAYSMMKAVGVSNTIRLNTKWRILTPNGFEPFSGIQKTFRDEHIQIVLSNGKILSTSTGHKLVMNNGELVESININNGDVLKGNGKDVTVVNTSFIQQPTDLYSILDSGEDHLYISQGVVSHNCDFSTSGDGVIATTKLNELKERNVIPPIEKQGQKDELWIWKEPEEESVYMCVADVARGDGEDFSGCIVFNIDTLEQVAEYKGLIGAKEYGNALINLATKYNDAVLVIENTGVGWATIQAVVDREYKNLFYSYRGSEDAYVDINVQRAKKNYSNIDKKDMVPGFSMSAKIRPHIIEKMEQFIRDDEVIIRSERLINELKTFVWLNGKAQAMRGYHDDLVMPLCTAIWIRETALRMKNVGRKYTKKMLEAINTNIPQDNTSRINDPYYMEVNSVDKQDNDIRWLFSDKDKQADNIHKQHRPPSNNSSNRPPGIYLGSG